MYNKDVYMFGLEQKDHCCGNTIYMFSLQSKISMECNYVIRSGVVTSKVLSIEGLNNCQTGQVFVGDIMVVYTTYLDKANKSRPIMCADMTDKDAMMTVTLTVPPQLVQKHAEKILPRNGISITNFNVFPKRVYDCGDCDQIINEASIVEKIIVIYLEYRFLSNSTIRQLA